MRKDHLLEGIDLILQAHQICNSFVSGSCQELNVRSCSHSPFIRVIDSLERDILLVFEKAIELGAKAMESEFRQDERDVGSNEGRVTCTRQIKYQVVS